MLSVINPATGKLIQELKEDTKDSIQEKFKSLKDGQKIWSVTNISQRKLIIKKFRDLAIEKKEKLAALLSSETGKPISQSRNELSGLTGRINFFLENVEHATATQNIFSDATQKLEEKITFEPLGVIANISAWNYPYFVGSNVFIPALLTGNAVLYKPSEFASLTGLAIADLFFEAGLPRDVFGAVIGDGRIGAAILELPINGVFFTGSYATGKKIAQTASSKLIKVQLELGGKDPVYVTDDVDVASVAVATADGAFYNNGQSCCAIERLYVHEKIYDSFVEQFFLTVNSFVMGDPMNEKVYIGPLTRTSQIAFLEQQVADAVAKGAKLVVGGKKSKVGAQYFEPTVLLNVDHCMEVMTEESFGPIIGIQKVRTDDEALKLMNDTKYGLTAGVYTRSKLRAEKILAQVNSGSVYWNCCDRVSPRLPWTGRSQSGIGSTLSVMGIQSFVQPKAWHLKG